MADHSHASTHPPGKAHAEHGHGGIGKYLAVFVALCVLTGISVFVGSNHYLRDTAPQAMWAMMMAVSCAKASLVILFFMHILWEANWKYVLTVPASMMSLFLVLMLVPDIGRRTLNYSSERWYHAPEPLALPADEVEDNPASAHDDHDHPAPATGGSGKKH